MNVNLCTRRLFYLCLLKQIRAAQSSSPYRVHDCVAILRWLIRSSGFKNADIPVELEQEDVEILVKHHIIIQLNAESATAILPCLFALEGPLGRFNTSLTELRCNCDFFFSLSLFFRYSVPTSVCSAIPAQFYCDRYA
jgi:hypothetical protein